MSLPPSMMLFPVSPSKKSKRFGIKLLTDPKLAFRLARMSSSEVPLAALLGFWPLEAKRKISLCFGLADDIGFFGFFTVSVILPPLTIGLVATIVLELAENCAPMLQSRADPPAVLSIVSSCTEVPPEGKASEIELGDTEITGGSRPVPSSAITMDPSSGSLLLMVRLPEIGAAVV